MTVQEQEKALNTLTQELYAASNRTFRPKFPWVFVRVLQREQQTDSGLILPATEQNKTLHEGIVLVTWKPVEFELDMRRKEESNGVITYHPEPAAKMRRESELKPGDHVLFPHWAGMPVDGFSEKRYRLVKEIGWHESKDGGICGVVEHSPVETKAVAKLKDMIVRMIDKGFMDWDKDLIASIEKQFVVVDRDGQSVTLSGR
jgi:co-chaperonin GroES (HSP10)